MQVDFEWLDERLKSIAHEIQIADDEDYNKILRFESVSVARDEMSDLRNDLHLMSLKQKSNDDKERSQTNDTKQN